MSDLVVEGNFNPPPVSSVFPSLITLPNLFRLLDMISKPFIHPQSLSFCCILVDLEQFLGVLELFGCLSSSFWFLNEWSALDILSCSVYRSKSSLVIKFQFDICIWKSKCFPNFFIHCWYLLYLWFHLCFLDYYCRKLELLHSRKELFFSLLFRFMLVFSRIVIDVYI